MTWLLVAAGLVAAFSTVSTLLYRSAVPWQRLLPLFSVIGIATWGLAFAIVNLFLATRGDDEASRWHTAFAVGGGSIFVIAAVIATWAQVRSTSRVPASYIFTAAAVFLAVASTVLYLTASNPRLNWW